MSIQMTQLAFTDAKMLICDKFEYYQALKRNGYKMPTYKSKFINSEVLIMIREEKIYCPRY